MSSFPENGLTLPVPMDPLVGPIHKGIDPQGCPSVVFQMIGLHVGPTSNFEILYIDDLKS